ncbi:MAG: hypothetical protein LC114_05070 [Bryobacterales bacterium]|nr:hypothetical protein [Bryobacterales bacterium]
MRRRLLFLALLLFSCVFLLPAAKEPKWLKLRSEHFELYSAEQEKQSRGLLEHLERVRNAYELLTDAKMPAGERVRVVLFRNEKEYREYAPDKLSIGHYVGERGRDYIVISDFDALTQTVLNHEFFHLFSRHARFRFPLWLEEGLADFYSTLKITDKDVTYGYPLTHHLRFLTSSFGKPLPLSSIFAITPRNLAGGDRDMAGRLYAQGWVLTHMTFQGKEMSGRSGEFFRMMRDGSTDAGAAYKAVYGLDTRQLDQLLAAYIRKAYFNFGGWRAEGLNFTAPTELAPMEDWETPLLLADILAIHQMGDRARQRYDELAAKFPGVPQIDESRAYLAWNSGDRERALSYFRAAAEKKSQSAMVYFRLAELACDYTVLTPDCTAWINDSLRLNPNDRQALNWAMGYMLNTGQFESAIAAIHRGGALSAAEAPDIFHKLGYAHYQLRQFKEAHAALKRGLEFAKKPEDIAKLNEMERHVTAAEQGDVVMQNASETQIRRGVFEERVKSDADHAMESFLELDGATVTSATLDAMDCSGAQPVAVVNTKRGPLRLAIDRPAAVVVIRRGEVVIDHEFSCGKQGSRPVFVGYLLDDAPAGSDGLLRILSFQ